MSIGLWLIVIIGGIAGFVSTMYIVDSLFSVIFYKVFRRIRYGISLFN